MNLIELKSKYESSKKNIKARISDFRSTKEEDYLNEYLFCLLTPQSNAKKCWEAILELNKIKNISKEEIVNILKTRTRFHNNKASYIIDAKTKWKEVKKQLSNPDKQELRNWLAANTKGYGLKEAAHFLRNIGKSENQIAILDRHILRNLKSLNVIEDDKIKSKAHYLELENKFKQFSKQTNIPLDELDLLFWSNETGEIFK